MKRAILAMIVVVMTAVSCKKNIASPAGFWTFNSATYTAVSCIADTSAATLTASNTLTGSNYSNIVINFADSLPALNGMYTVGAAGTHFGKDSVTITLAYMSTGVLNYYGSQGVSKQKVNVTIANGKLSVSGAGISMLPTSGTLDTIPLTFNISQE
jgi:hypothetical protein